MNKKAILLAERRELLIAQVAVQRAGLTHAFKQWRAPLALLEYGVVTWARIRRHPLLLASVAFIMMTRRSHGMNHWLKRTWSVWQLWRAVRKK